MTRRLAGFGLAVLAGVLLALAVAQFVSWLELTRSKRYIEDLAATGWIADELAWRRRHDILQAQRFPAGLGPDRYWLMGEMHYWRGAGMNLWPEQQHAEMEIAKTYYIQAATRSPGNAELLARIAYRLVHMSDPLALPVMRRAVTIGPYEPVVQFHSAEVGMRLWPEMGEELREAFRDMIAHGMGNYRLDDRLKAIARRNGWTEHLDAIIQESGS